MTKKTRLIFAILLTLVIVFLGIRVGSVQVSLGDIYQVIFGTNIQSEQDPIIRSILVNVRFPRVALSFLVGASLAVSGAVMQSLLSNPLASAYTLGVSSGASLGAALIIISGISIPIISIYLLPTTGFIFGLLTVLIVLSISKQLDNSLSNQTVILVGMVITLFVGAIITMITAFAQSHLQQLVFWQMGSFSGSSWEKVGVLLPITVLGITILWGTSNELDILSFGEEQAKIAGLEVNKVKFKVMIIASLLTGASVSFVGVIGFIDLIAPHIVRKIFGATHKWLIPMCALLGGGMMVLADVISRSLLSPREIPVGAVTALIGAPFFMYVFFGKRRNSL
ncbi:ABC transporter permease [Floricoccus tropicus]|uniref:ABC transporter permease n=1 Tax=Floricoccus tropicus TaxID=1859473 RepID=A0A1E8GPE3_9LACT|nr:iron ABC transporter permease [Floricoccus tropicus]OFI49896.1 ABC transporter permease [Floricoccus tropicus]